MDETRNRLLRLIADPRLASEVPSDEARELLAEVAVLQGGLVAVQGALLPRALGQNVGGALRDADQHVSLKDGARILSLSASYLYKHADSLPFVRRVGRRLVCSVREMEKWMYSRTAA